MGERGRTRGKRGSDWSWIGVELGVGLGGWTGGADGGSDWGRTEGGRMGGRTRGGWTRGLDWRSNEVAGKISQVSLRFADMSSDMNVILHPTCPSLDKVNFGLDKVTSRSVTVTAEAVTTS